MAYLVIVVRGDRKKISLLLKLEMDHEWDPWECFWRCLKSFSKTSFHFQLSFFSFQFSFSVFKVFEMAFGGYSFDVFQKSEIIKTCLAHLNPESFQ